MTVLCASRDSEANSARKALGIEVTLELVASPGNPKTLTVNYKLMKSPDGYVDDHAPDGWHVYAEH